MKTAHSGVITQWWRVVMLVIFLTCLVPSYADAAPEPAATDVSTTDVSTITIVGLSNAGSYLDGATVDFTGEAVGDIIDGDVGFVWLTLYDQGASIPVQVAESDAVLIEYLGRYQVKGTTLRITGTFHLACDDHDGLSDVHATTVSVVDPGERLTQELDYTQLHFGLALVSVGALFLIAYWYLKERQR